MLELDRILLSLSLIVCAACSDPTVVAESSDGAESDDAATSDDAESSDEGETETGETPDMGVAPDPNEQIPPPDPEGCHAIYAQDLLPTFELTIHPVVWELLQSQWNNGEALEEMGLDPKEYHPLQEFRYGDIVIEDAEIRLRGNASYWEPLPEDKMQFQIGFHRNDPEHGHFLGLKRLVFDAATYNRHMLRDRLSLAFMRSVGIAAPCANNARVVINGEYYGIFTNIEKLDEVFLERVFDDPTGDLWKRANWQLKTNLDTADDDRLDALEEASTLEVVETYLNLAQALRVYAADAVIPNSDGPWAGGLNFYLYDDPIDGKFWLLPWDLDNTFERFNDPPDGEYPMNPDPFVWEKQSTHGRPWYDYSLADPEWFAFYVDQIDDIVHTGYTPAQMHARIDEWTAQIQDAVLDDLNKPYDNDTYWDKVEELHAYVDQRYAFLIAWLDCWQNRGVDDGNGYCTPG